MIAGLLHAIATIAHRQARRRSSVVWWIIAGLAWWLVRDEVSREISESHRVRRGQRLHVEVSGPET